MWQGRSLCAPVTEGHGRRGAGSGRRWLPVAMAPSTQPLFAALRLVKAPVTPPASSSPPGNALP